MLQKTISNYFPKRLFVNEIFINRCSFIENHESIFFLKKPKLLYDLSENSSKNLGIEINNIINPSYNIKNEKKSKSNFKSLDTIESKKNKLKQKKKVRSKIYVDKDFSNTNEDLELNSDNNLTFMRPSKNLKNKKIHKEKVFLRSNIFPDSIDSKSVISNNDMKQVYLDKLLTVKELSDKLQIPSAEIIKWLFLQGISVTMNQLLDVSISTKVAKNYSFKVLKQKVQYNSLTMNMPYKGIDIGKPRSPVITILGHVDHGKTTLLNCIRKNHETNQEAGNITQCIGSYEVCLSVGKVVKKIIFLDTPGHESFVSIRRLGAQITDIVILVVSADDGLKPQTIEAIEHIKQLNLTFLVAINKIDKVEADINKVKKQLSSFDIVDKDIIIIGISALTGKNIDKLLSSLFKLYESQNLKSDPSKLAEGIILEAYLDKQRGPIAKLLIQNGTLFVGDIVLSGNRYGKVKAILSIYGNKVGSIQSNALAEILGFSSVPDVGLPFKVVKDEKSARSQLTANFILSSVSNPLNNRIVLDPLHVDGKKCTVKQINLIIKTDVQGSIDPIIYSFSKIPQEKVQVNIISIASGQVSLNDIKLASTSKSIILAFNLNVASSILDNANNLFLTVKQFNVIYDLIDYVKNYMLKFVEISYKKEVLGHAEVKSLFTINKGVVAGCLIMDGKMKKNAFISILRNEKIIYDGLLNSLKIGKENVDEVLSGNECGLMCNNYFLWEINDVIEAYLRKPLEKTL
uniref:Translation initiation factor IF-2, chloroplastic n=1 Tax=Synarthrophyton chejuense TaxID=2485825 RepID=A0A3G3MG21_9FLOR|nr:translation initiation factor 2 [Synarthrophyton chejuense]AYR05768.1 translation initiation factor 2 [Synarthrophyton chejuense]